MPIIKDEELKKKQSNYWHPVKGSWERFKSRWENNTNPIKGVLDSGLLSIIPGLNIGQAVYDGSKLFSNEGVKKTYNHFKNRDFSKAAISGLGDIFTVTTAIPGGKAIRNSNLGKKAEQNIIEVADRTKQNTSRIVNRVEDKVLGVSDYLRYKNSPNIYNNSPQYVNREKSEPIILTRGTDGVVEYLQYNPKTNRTPRKAEWMLENQKWYGYDPDGGGFFEFANITPSKPNILNLHLSDKSTNMPAMKVIKESPKGTYVGDTMWEGEGENAPLSKAATVGQKLLNTDGTFDFWKALFSKPNTKIVNYSEDSYPYLLRQAKNKGFGLRYLENVYTPLNSSGVNSTFLNNIKDSDIKTQLNLINKEYIRKANPKARKAIIKDGQILFPHPMIIKTK